MTITIAHHFNPNRVWGGTTIAYMLEGPDLIHVAVAICDPKDQYVKKVGAALAIKRLKERKAGYSVMDISPGRTDIINHLGSIMRGYVEDITSEEATNTFIEEQEGVIDEFLKTKINNRFREHLIRKRIDALYGYASDVDGYEMHQIYKK